MQNLTQLLCSFTTEEYLQSTIEKIIHSYQIAFDTIYVLENIDIPGAMCCTYNIPVNSLVKYPTPENTISLHRKKATNTLYTINALNELLESLYGKQDTRIVLQWENYKNTILVTAYGKFKQINTKLYKIVKTNEL